MKIKIILLKIYSLCNYKIDILNFFFILKKNKKKINLLYYILNNFYYYKKKIFSNIIYNFICNKIIKFNNFNKYFFSKKNIFLKKLKNYYKNWEIFYFYKILKKNNIFNNLKINKKIYTNLLLKINNKIFETLNEKMLIIYLSIFMNIKKNRHLDIFNMYYFYNNNNFFFFLKDLKKTSSLIFLNKNQDYCKKIYLGLLKYDSYNSINYLFFIINNFIKYKEFKLEISIDIFDIKIIKIIKIIKKIKIIKIFLTIGFPDLFIEYIIKNKYWYCFNSIDVKNNYNYYIQSYYDEYIGHGTYRHMYNKIINNNNIFKIKINSRKILLKILKKIKFNFFFLDSLNRNNINKNFGNIYCNFFHSKIFDKNNFFNKNFFYLKNNNILIQKNNSFYLEIKKKFFLRKCIFLKKNFFLLYKLIEKKTECEIIESEKYFYLNFRNRPIIINIYLNYFLQKEYIYYIFFIINCYFSKKNEPYCYYIGSEIFSNDFFYKKNFFSKKWLFLIKKINKNGIRNSFYLKFNLKKKINKIILFDNFLIKSILLKWQNKNETN
ncbi:putative ribonucleotide-diphosphate reductase alpha subunit [Candidatus Carsonella ruddii CS isolate Thao2000]|uniref:Putative ribonucleotide-diphosphate reductase alpha subunit n=1 Tax=Candidatus Carsonella ruddii CS isolate Thao2000 TaxID=1202537 RepID=J7GYK8_CARRU|nr:ribonucleotide-diphosphate reductase subunit alpha [Candidatus Carsonella ruddii]AFP83678.1 putative ribonucleotide-diphosphate reductase alpha subunit [Candidatus Carsonella ruddii CS isolate Thao2000]